MPVSGYFDTVFGSAGELATIPDGVQSDGSVSYSSGWGIDYTLPNTNPSYKYMPWGQFNQLFYDITTAIQNWQQNTIAPFITTTMNGGTPFTYPKYAIVFSGGTAYISNVAGNADTPPSAKWTALNVAALGTMASQNANAVAITGGTIDGTVIGGTTPAAGNFTTTAVGANTTAAATMQALGNWRTVQTYTSSQTLGASDYGKLTYVNGSGITITLVGSGVPFGAMVCLWNEGTAAATISSTNINYPGGTAEQGVASYPLAPAQVAILISDGTSWTWVAGSGLGCGQVWTNPSRVIGTTYTNSTNKPIQLNISLNFTASSGGALILISGSTNVADISGNVTNDNLGFMTAIIPPGITYAVNGTNVTINNWSELR